MKVTDGSDTSAKKSSTPELVKSVPGESPGNGNGTGNGLHPYELSSSEDQESEVEYATTNGHNGAPASVPNGSGKHSKKGVRGDSEEMKGDSATATSSDEGDDAKDKALDSSKGESQDDVFYVHDSGLTIKIVAPGAEPFEIQVWRIHPMK